MAVGWRNYFNGRILGVKAQYVYGNMQSIISFHTPFLTAIF